LRAPTRWCQHCRQQGGPVAGRAVAGRMQLHVKPWIRSSAAFSDRCLFTVLSETLLGPSTARKYSAMQGCGSISRAIRCCVRRRSFATGQAQLPPLRTARSETESSCVKVDDGLMMGQTPDQLAPRVPHTPSSHI
jgi:hypothetical protein